jgi:uncharacterized protein
VSEQLPSEETALKLLKEAGCSKKVIKHCQAVANFAEKIAEACRKKGIKIDVSLVRIGALLHDVGRAKTHGVEHGVVGAKIMRELNLPDVVVSIIERHVGGGISSKEAEKLGFPVKSYVPESIEERIVAYADKLIEGSMRVPVNVAVKRFRQDTNIPETAVERLKLWHEELSACLE